MKQIAAFRAAYRTRSLLGAAAALILAACGAGSGQGLDENGNLIRPSVEAPALDDPGGTLVSASGNPNATLAWVQANVFGGVCSQCHTGAGAPLGVDWSSAARTCANLGRSSGEIPSMMEIASANPDGSYVVWKIQGQGPNGESIVGEQMPAQNPALDADTIKNITDWIGDGTPGCESQLQPNLAGLPMLVALRH